MYKKDIYTIRWQVADLPAIDLDNSLSQVKVNVVGVILEKLCVGQEYTLEDIQHHQTCLQILTHIPRSILSYPVHILACFYGRRRQETEENPEKMHMDTMHRQQLELRIKPKTLKLLGNNTTHWTTTPLLNPVTLFKDRNKMGDSQISRMPCSHPVEKNPSSHHSSSPSSSSPSNGSMQLPISISRLRYKPVTIYKK